MGRFFLEENILLFRLINYEKFMNSLRLNVILHCLPWLYLIIYDMEYLNSSR